MGLLKILCSILIVLMLPILSACGLLERDGLVSDGVIAVIDGQLKKVSEEEQDKICATQYCEPNYVYTVNFGRRRAEPRPVLPPVIPVPAPVPPTFPTPTVQPSGDSVDYSKAILGLFEAWKLSEGSREIIVAVVDSGVAVGHPDLQANIWMNMHELEGKPGLDDDRNGYVDDVYGWDYFHNRPNAIDDNNHGTHVAGIIGAMMNGIGTIGISPLVKIMPLKFLGPDGSGDTLGAIRAIDYATDHGAKIISNSWGGGGYSLYMDQAIQRAIQKGVIVVAAAGNSTMNNDTFASFPANYAGVISVASSDEKDGLSSFSNYGARSVAIAAPGSHIFSTVLENRWDYLSGTSMAAPQVSGALALAMSVNADLSATDLKKLLCQSSKKILLDQVGCGRMDVLGLVKASIAGM
ncbi:MAG: hypothetical protein A2070_11030 [Bdellovibrionales bacterium GWC1_52_8]|nr:MAG: hypothetical protein A2X97_15865 [Bdellovibrionales bacterium GWA1_52_35]OFZ40293.1 MAG: hypothetical protein A2070_11030 [Bdellovibrionales bacterium GWC1_52_8]